MNATEPTAELEAPMSVARALPAGLVRQVREFAEQLQQSPTAPAIDESDSWSEEDLRDVSRAAAHRLDQFPPAE